MRDYRIEILEPGDARIEKFRRRVIAEDFNCDPDFADLFENKTTFDKSFRGHPDKEEIFKFSKAKFSRCRFDGIACLLEGDDEVVSISGCRWYTPRFLRLGMHYYTLTCARARHRSPLWRKDGFIERSAEYFPQAEAYFITIYPHNTRLKAWVHRLQGGRRFAQLGLNQDGVIERLKQFKVLPGLHPFNEVPQMFMVHPGKAGTVPEDFLSSVLEGNG